MPLFFLLRCEYIKRVRYTYGYALVNISYYIIAGCVPKFQNIQNIHEDVDFSTKTERTKKTN